MAIRPSTSPFWSITLLPEKRLYHSPVKQHLHEMIGQFWQSYADARGESFEKLRISHRVGRLLLMLLLARVDDGKSPVEYLDSDRKQFVREFVNSGANHLRRGDVQLESITTEWFARLPGASSRS